MRARTMSTPRAGAFARTGNVNKSSDGSAACGASLRDTLLGEMVRPCNAAAVRFRKPDSTIANEKTRGRFPGAGFCSSCDDGDHAGDLPDVSNFFLEAAADLVAEFSSQILAPAAQIFRRQPLRQVLKQAMASPWRQLAGRSRRRLVLHGARASADARLPRNARSRVPRCIR